MSSSTDFREELLELADCEVVGALDSASAARLEGLFRDSPPSLRQEVIDRQARLAADAFLLPALEPDASLRHRVLDAVQAEIQAVEESDRRSDSPLASIGSHLNRGRWTIGGTSVEDPLLAAAGPSVSTYAWRRASRIWRATAIVLAGALMAAVVFNIATTRQATRISELALQRVVSDQLLEYIGPDLATFLDQRCIVRGLAGVSMRDNGSASVVLTPDRSSLMVIWIDLPVAQEFTLRAVSPEGGAGTDVGVFFTVGPLGGAKIALAPEAVITDAEWEIVDSRGAVIFRSAPR
jgi:hypothetical protein